MKLKLILILFVSVSLNYVASQSANCDFSDDGDDNYQCSLTIRSPYDAELTEITGEHEEDENKSDDDVTKITHYDVEVDTLPSIICQKFKNIKKLNLNYANFNNLDENSLKYCGNVIEIDFDRNNLKVLQNGIFASQEKAERLSIWKNQISELAEGVFDPLINVNYLSLDDNGLTKLPMGIFRNLKNLQRLRLNDNKLTVIHSKSFGFHSKFAHFHFKSNEINAFDERLLANAALESIESYLNPCIDNNRRDEYSDYGSGETDSGIKSKLKLCFANYNKNFLKITTAPRLKTTERSEISNEISNLKSDNADMKVALNKLRESIQKIQADKETTKNAVDNEINNLREEIKAANTQIKELNEKFQGVKQETSDNDENDKPKDEINSDNNEVTTENIQEEESTEVVGEKIETDEEKTDRVTEAVTENVQEEEKTEVDEEKIKKVETDEESNDQVTETVTENVQEEENEN